MLFIMYYYFWYFQLEGKYFKLFCWLYGSQSKRPQKFLVIITGTIPFCSRHHPLLFTLQVFFLTTISTCRKKDLSLLLPLSHLRELRRRMNSLQSELWWKSQSMWSAVQIYTETRLRTAVTAPFSLIPCVVRVRMTLMMVSVISTHSRYKTI